MKVFIVTEGEYSDYHINAVFQTRELAEEAILKEMKPEEREKWVAAQGNGDRWIEIEEHELLESTDQILTYNAWRDYTGKFHTAAEKVYQQEWDTEETRVWSTDGHTGRRKYWVNARALTKDRALKIAQDAIAKLKAEEAGL